MRNLVAVILFFWLSFSFVTNVTSQTITNDTLKFDYKKIYAFCLDANLKPVFSLIEVDKTNQLSVEDMQFKIKFDDRFKYPTDSSGYLAEKNSVIAGIDNLLSIFHNYWRHHFLILQ